MPAYVITCCLPLKVLSPYPALPDKLVLNTLRKMYKTEFCLNNHTNGRNTKIDKKATILREQTDMGGKYDSNTVSVKWGTDSYGNYYIYILVDGTAVCALPGWTRLD